MQARELTAAADFHRNRLLAQVASADLDALLGHAVLVRAERGEVLFEPGAPVAAAHFPCDGTLVSLAVQAGGGRYAETILTGREGAVGGIISSAACPAYARAVVQIAGELIRIAHEPLENRRQCSPALDDLLARHADCLLAQLLQSIACSAVHKLEARMASWLLVACDCAGTNELPLTQDYLARLLGVGRTYVTRTASDFQARGLISYRRGHITITGPQGLGAAACQCRDSIRGHFDRVLPGVYPASSDNTV